MRCLQMINSKRNIVNLLHWSTFFFDQNVTGKRVHVSGLVSHADSENQVRFFLSRQIFSLESVSVSRRGLIFIKYCICLIKSVNYFLA